MVPSNLNTMNESRRSQERGWIEGLVSLFYPEVCQICGEESAIPENGYVGSSCRKKLKPIQFPFCNRCGMPFSGDIQHPFECYHCSSERLFFDQARAAMVAEGILLDIIHRFKYKGALWFEPFLAGLLIECAQTALSGKTWDFIVPVPLHPLKKREREFNQSERLANCLSSELHIPVNVNLVKRVKYTQTQTMLNRHQRNENVKNAFMPYAQEGAKGARVILIDDVYTTGATTNDCSRALRTAGANSIYVLAVARGV
jgi:ComF family protein